MNKKYRSRYGADSDITAAQYLVEFIMERAAKKEKTTLPFKFWNIPKWNKIFRMQIKYANDLLKDYTEEEIFSALRTKKGERIYSLGAKKTIIIPLIEDIKTNKFNSIPIICNENINQSKLEDWHEEENIIEACKNIGKKDASLWSKLG